MPTDAGLSSSMVRCLFGKCRDFWRVMKVFANLIENPAYTTRDQSIYIRIYGFPLALRRLLFGQPISGASGQNSKKNTDALSSDLSQRNCLPPYLHPFPLYGLATWVTVLRSMGLTKNPPVVLSIQTPFFQQAPTGGQGQAQPAPGSLEAPAAAWGQKSAPRSPLLHLVRKTRKTRSEKIMVGDPRQTATLTVLPDYRREGYTSVPSLQKEL